MYTMYREKYWLVKVFVVHSYTIYMVFRVIAINLYWRFSFIYFFVEMINIKKYIFLYLLK